MKPIHYLVIAAIVIILLGALYFIPACRAQEIDEQKLADAIYKAENSKTHPYGILTHYKTTTPRQACLNTIRSAKRRYEKSNLRIDFISFLGKTYCPIGAENDPQRLNKNWVKNVKFYYGRTK